MALHWAVYSLALLLLSIAKYIPLPTLVPASLDIGKWKFEILRVSKNVVTFFLYTYCIRVSSWLK